MKVRRIKSIMRIITAKIILLAVNPQCLDRFRNHFLLSQQTSCSFFRVLSLNFSGTTPVQKFEAVPDYCIYTPIGILGIRLKEYGENPRFCARLPRGFRTRANYDLLMWVLVCKTVTKSGGYPLSTALTYKGMPPEILPNSAIWIDALVTLMISSISIGSGRFSFTAFRNECTSEACPLRSPLNRRR